MKMKTLLSGYLLSSQGDRMMMGNSVEGRFPFLDYRVIEFASKVPPHFKMRGLNEKYILKRTYRNLLPAEIVNRSKQPYRAPIARCFIGENTDQNIRSLLDEEAIKRFGYFDHVKVAKLIEKVKRFGTVSARDDMAVVAIVSMQLLHHHFIASTNFVHE